MAYNKAREERKWRLWKEAEEKQLRSLGVSEGDIEKLRVHDWAIFNSDRRYYEKLQDAGTVIVASISSKVDVKPKLPTHYFIDAECGLQLPSPNLPVRPSDEVIHQHNL